jgi:hypothetical protein
MGKRAINKMLWLLGAIRMVVDRFLIVIYTGHAFLSLEKFVKCVVSDKKIIGMTVLPSSRELCVIVRNPYTHPRIVFITRKGSNLLFPPPVRSMHLAINVSFLIFKPLLRSI